MSERERQRLKAIHTFPELVKYLHTDLGWPVEQDSFEDLDDITFDWEPGELGIDPGQAAKIEYIKQLRPLENGQPQGVFFVKFSAKSLPVVALRRLLSKLVIKKRASAKAAERPLWAMRDLVFISSYGEKDERQLSFAYFQEPEHAHDLPSLKVLGWDDRDTVLHLDRVHDQLQTHLAWPDDSKKLAVWRRDWSRAFELRHGEVVTTAKQLAEQIAGLARRIRERAIQLLKLETESGPLRTLMAGFKKALIHDLTEDQFADMYAQTIAYGLLSARITHPDPVKAETLPDLIPVTNPFLKELLETFVTAGGKKRGRRRGHHLDFDELGIDEVVELLRRANMDAVLRNFGADDRKEDPVTYFYEDFLNAYDKQERKRRGVYYTPKPVVSYIVRSVHELLQSEFGIEDGLASTITWGEMAKRHADLKIPEGTSADSPFVQILDPATGTATFLVTVIEVIHETLSAKWTKAGLAEAKRLEAWNNYVPKHLLPRLYGYELMMAPYAIAHLKIGLKLYETGYRFGSNERARIYLTNSLESATDASETQIDALSEALAHEASAVNGIKRHQRFAVVVGNPPYSNSISEPEWLMTLLDDWKRGLNEAKSDLNREEWKFLRFAENICQATRTGIIGFIINRDFLDGITKRVMREHLAATFPHRTVVDLNGDVKGNVSDENVFDIEQGVAIALLRTTNRTPRLQFTSRVGTRTQKYADLLSKTAIDSTFEDLQPGPPYFRWVPLAGGAESASLENEYLSWCGVDEIFGIRSSGIQTKNDDICIGWSANEVWDRVRLLADTSPAQASRELGISQGGVWSAAAAKKDLLSTGPTRERIRRILYRPFDWRFTYLTEKSGGFLGRPRFDVMKHMVVESNVGLIFNRQIVGESVSHFAVARDLICHGTFYLGNKGQDYIAPLYLVEEGQLQLGGRSRRPNISDQWLRAVGAAIGVRATEVPPMDVLSYVYAVVHSPLYRARYSDYIRRDFARVPLPGGPKLFRELGPLGAQLTKLHLLESTDVCDFITSYAGPKNPEVSRVSWSDDTVWLDAAATRKGQPATPGTIGFRGVPEAVWNFHIGGYQVCEKWLKDRKGRKLSKHDIEHYQKIVAAISETIRIMKEIDEVIEKHGGWPGAFQTGDTGGKKGH
ncbi:MAG: hypothetical protein K1X67_16005 [Fimbriimonadaceae bacterium]|nr:hypothetical protein [Fimbriimonadaceae bacterium]